MNKSRLLGAICGCLLVLISAENTAAPVFLGGTPYLSASDSPFWSTNGGAFTAADLNTSFFIEDFEDGVLENGITAFAPPDGTWSAICTSTDTPCGGADSVDADDGLIDGWGGSGYSYHVSSLGDASVHFSFDAGILGVAPTHVGVVWTDGYGDPITLEAFDLLGNSLGVFSTGTQIAGNSETSEDRFLGVIYSQGISSIILSNVGGGIEADHLQWGYSAVPIPPSFLLFGTGLLGLIGISRRKRAI